MMFLSQSCLNISSSLNPGIWIPNAQHFGNSLCQFGGGGWGTLGKCTLSGEGPPFLPVPVSFLVSLDSVSIIPPSTERQEDVIRHGPEQGRLTHEAEWSSNLRWQTGRGSRFKRSRSTLPTVSCTCCPPQFFSSLLFLPRCLQHARAPPGQLQHTCQVPWKTAHFKNIFLLLYEIWKSTGGVRGRFWSTSLTTPSPEFKTEKMRNWKKPNEQIPPCLHYATEFLGERTAIFAIWIFIFFCHSVACGMLSICVLDQSFADSNWGIHCASYTGLLRSKPGAYSQGWVWRGLGGNRPMIQMCIFLCYFICIEGKVRCWVAVILPVQSKVRSIAQWQSTCFSCRGSQVQILPSLGRAGRESLSETLEGCCQSVLATLSTRVDQSSDSAASCVPMGATCNFPVLWGRLSACYQKLCIQGCVF